MLYSFACFCIQANLKCHLNKYATSDFWFLISDLLDPNRLPKESLSCFIRPARQTVRRAQDENASVGVGGKWVSGWMTGEWKRLKWVWYATSHSLFLEFPVLISLTLPHLHSSHCHGNHGYHGPLPPTPSCTTQQLKTPTYIIKSKRSGQGIRESSFTCWYRWK